MVFNDIIRKTKEAFWGGFLSRHLEQTHRLTGEYWIKLYENGNLIEERHGKNIIVNSASILIARLLKDNHEPDGGITYLAVGTGGIGWDKQNPPQPTVIQTQLNAEIARKAFSTEDVTFIDPDTGNPTIVPTNVVDYTATFDETEAVGPLLEMGLFGGDASNLSGSGTEVNYRTFPVLNKSSSMTLTIIFRIKA